MGHQMMSNWHWRHDDQCSEVGEKLIRRKKLQQFPESSLSLQAKRNELEDIVVGNRVA